MAKKVVTDGSVVTAKKQRVIEEEQKINDEKVDFSLEFTPSEERAWIHEERCGTLILVVSIVMAVIVGFVNSLISKAFDYSTTATVIDTVIVFVVAYLLKYIATPFVRMYVKKNYNLENADMVTSSMVSSRSILGSVFMYLVMALGMCIIFLNCL